MTYWFRPDADIRERLRFWFRAEPVVDAEIRSRFAVLVKAASDGRLAEWGRPHGAGWFLFSSWTSFGATFTASRVRPSHWMAPCWHFVAAE